VDAGAAIFQRFIGNVPGAAVDDERRLQDLERPSKLMIQHGVNRETRNEARVSKDVTSEHQLTFDVISRPAGPNESGSMSFRALGWTRER
jgi:hypothetical protein